MLRTLMTVVPASCHFSCKSSCAKMTCSPLLKLNIYFNRYEFRNLYILSNNCVFNSTQNLLETDNDYHIPMERSNEMNHFWEDYAKKLGFRRRCINKVTTFLQCDEKTASELVSEHPILFSEDVDNTTENVKLLCENDIPPNTIKKNLWLLYYDHIDLKSRLDTVKQWDLIGCTIKDLLSIFRLSPSDFERVSDTFFSEKETIPYGNRIIYLSKLLEVSVPYLTEQLVRHKYLLVRKMDLIVEAIKCYKDFGISEEELVSDIWALRYTEAVIRKRLKIVREVGFRRMKAWYVRCSEENFDKMIETIQLEKSIIHPFRTREEYLANKLGIELPVMMQVIKRHSVLMRVHIEKLVEILDFLLENGFKGSDICFGHRIFSFSFETIKNRINELKMLGVHPLTLSLFIKNETDFRKCVRRLEYVYGIGKEPSKNEQ